MKRAFPAGRILGTCLLGVGLMVIASVGNAAEDPAAAGGPPAELVRAEGTVTVTGQGQTVGAPLVSGPG